MWTPTVSSSASRLRPSDSASRPNPPASSFVLLPRSYAMRSLGHSVSFLVKGPLILLMLVVINALTSPGHWWVQWAALGIGIAWTISLLRVVRAVIVVG